MRPTPRPSDFTAECRTAVAAAEAAGALLRSRFPDGFAARPKGALGDVVTDLDLLAESMVVDRIRADYPHDRVLAEESGDLGGDDGGCGRTWLVDPLDGSNNVVIGLPVYVVGIALCVEGAPVVGVVHDPVTGRTWSARRGAGAHGPAGPLAPARRPPSSAGPLLAWTQGHAVRRDDPAVRALRHTLELGSRRLLQLWAPLVAWAMLARGDIDGFVGYRAEAVDLPAGALLAREAGVVLCGLDGGEFTAGFTGPDTDRSFVAGRPEVLPSLLDLVAAATPLPGRAPQGRAGTSATG
ncbi:inositol monophosphatase [Streptomyces sp. NPDC000658]|uniref:inositol monophosphatase family protein n=1 Tax=Streptomyces sp. NPDC000658 TaxID=3154266 RepID=UPI00332B5D38